ncbi:MAG: SDR family oxidoreductase [Chloroflexi bacterium]|jgi:NAD(P)-dependent dehydrogenase (short-subunit alcohol dehydrogenase family)|nr:SDR family oxidoreductase [Chloroflexota bacterium]MBT4340742.1 SDR family oxidoreductase [Chloroflexota bacterium]MBT6707769.1 SDR family oxidoreductase [Chloroflexota bacterium]MBT7468712.1 SDR family oxidoreductase [Chloroflexota bacterium]
MITQNPNISLKGKVAFISGASKGIGVSIAELFAIAGCDLALTARNEQELDQTAKNARKAGVNVWTQTAEMSDADEVKAVGNAALAEFGHIDILVNNAGVTIPQLILETTLENFQTIINVNVLAPFLLTQIFAPSMIAKKQGKIVNVTSRAAIRAFPTGSVYSASKGALQLLTQSMAVEFGPHNIQTNSVAPTVTMTPMGDNAWPPSPRRDAKLAKIPTGRFAEPEEVADAVLYLASENSNFINGVELPIDGGEGAG